MRLRGAGTLAAVIVATAALAPPSEACDSASCALLTRGQDGIVPKGSWIVDLSLRYTDEGQPLLGTAPALEALRPRVDFSGRRLQPFYHVELDGSDTIVQADAAYGLTSRLALTASLPLLGVHSYNHIHYPPALPATPAPADPTDEAHAHAAGATGPTLLHLRTEGNGDALVGVRYAVLSGPGQALTGGLALKLPTGRSQIADPHDGGLFDPMLQPGTGSWDGVASAQYARRGAGMSWSASGSYQVTTTNGLGYRFGHEAIAGLGVSRERGRFTASCQLKGHRRQRSRYLGQDVPSTGGAMLIVTPGVRMRTRTGSLYAFYQRPVYRRVNEYQLASRGALLMGLSRAF